MTDDTGTAIINIDRAIFNNDFGPLTPDERVLHGKRICESIGINHHTQPIKWIQMRGGKWVPYADKNCSDQLRAKYNITVEVTSRDIKDGLLTVHARATAPNGRRDEDFGVVPVAGLRGEEASNAVMKAVTKAKRRVTLSICGMGGMMDESEIESMTPTFADLGHGSIRSTPPLTAESLPPSKITQPPPKADKDAPHEIELIDDDWSVWGTTLVACMRRAPDIDAIDLWIDANQDRLHELSVLNNDNYKKLVDIADHEKAKRNE